MPFLVSMDKSHNDEHLYAVFESEEGITFLSYAQNWDVKKLEELHEELLKNPHGKEISDLTRVTIYPNKNKDINGLYYMDTKEILLYNGKKKKNAIDFRYTLSHEYGHHIQNTYFPEISKQLHTTWSKLRGIDNMPIVKGNSGNNKGEHKWYASEIFAEDYVMLYSATQKIDVKNLEDRDDVYYLSQEHENDEISNVMENQKLQQWLEKKTGFLIDQKRMIPTMKPISLKRTNEEFFSPVLTLNAKKTEQIQFYEKATFYEEQKNGTYKWNDEDEKITSTVNDQQQLVETIGYMTKWLPKTKSSYKGVYELKYTKIDTNTNLAVTSPPIYILVKNRDDMRLLSEKESKEIENKLIKKQAK
jgi:DNA-directed RNA polymerase subunit F